MRRINIALRCSGNASGGGNPGRHHSERKRFSAVAKGLGRSASTLLVCSLMFCLIPAAGAQSDKDAAAAKQPTAAEMSRTETVAKAFTRQFDFQEYEVRASAEAMPEDKWDYRPAPGMFKNEKPEFGPAEVRTFREQVKHVACANFAFAAELDGTKPPEACDKGGPSPANTRAELLTYLRDSFTTLKRSLAAITVKNMYDPIEGPYAGPNTRLGLADVCIWHNADHYGQMVFYLRMNGIVPPSSRANPPKLQEKY